MVGTPAMRGNVISYAEARRISAGTFVKWTRRLVPEEGDILLAREAPVGPVVRIPSGGKVAAGQRTMHLRANPAVVDPLFLYYLLMSPLVQRRLSSRAMGSTVSHLRVADVRAFELPQLPPLERQKAVSELLGALDDKITANDHVVGLADQLCAADVRDAARSAVAVPLREMLVLSYGKALTATDRVPGTVVVYGSGGPTGMHNTPLVDGPGVVVGRKGTVGAVYWASGPHYPIDTTYYVQPIADVPNEIIYHGLRALSLGALNSDSAVPGLNREEAYAQVIRLPRGEVARRVQENLSIRFALMKGFRTENVRLVGLRDELLPLLMSGKVRVRDAEKLVEEVV